MNENRVPPATRLRCLSDMGIDVWVRRDRRPAAEPAPGVEDPAGSPRRAVPADAVPAAVRRSVPDAADRATFQDELAKCDWEELRARILACTRCPLHRGRTQGVVGVGSTRAALMLVGEAPGAEEDRLGEPFVGRAGKLLDQMLAAIGLSRERVYITNILKSRPPRNRDPQPDEVAACEPYLRRQIELISPRLIIALGRVAAQNLLKTDRPLGRLRGSWHRYGPQGTPLLPTYHPAYLLRNPADKRKAWQDLKRVRSQLDETAREDPSA